MLRTIRWNPKKDTRRIPVFEYGEYERIKKEEPEIYQDLLYGQIVQPESNARSSSIFDDPFWHRVIGHFLREGKRAEYEDMIREVMYLIKRDQLKGWRNASSEEERKKFELDPLELMRKAVDNCKPVVWIKEVKKGGVTYQVPFSLSEYNATFQALRWIRQAAHDHPKPWREIFVPAIVREFTRAFNNEGRAIKNKHDLHKLAETNKAYAHYRFTKKNT